MIEPPPKGATSQHHQNRTHFNLNSGEDTSQGTLNRSLSKVGGQTGVWTRILWSGLCYLVDKNIDVTLRTQGFHLDM